MNKYILAIDQGTTSTRAILFDRKSIPLYSAQREVKCYYPHSGWVESDPLELWVSVIDVINEILVKANITMKNIDSIGITNQRETTIVWDKETGMPVYRAIIWQSRQSNDICERLKKYEKFIQSKTGLIMNPYFSASKIRFILDHIPNGQERARKGQLMFGTVDTWILYKLTSGEVFATDVSNASRTLLFNIHTMSWDKELCDLFDIPMNMLPIVRPSSYRFGKASFFSSEVYVCGIAGDQQAALFGQTCFEKGESKNTYGTGCFMLLNIGDKPMISTNGLLTTVAWQIKDKVTYALEGSVFIGGAVVQWLRDEMQLIEKASDSEKMANKTDDCNGVYIVPAFVGLGTPYWDNDARGAVFGLTRGTTKEHIIRATLESIAYQSKDVIETMKKETKLCFSQIAVDGGASENDFLMQFQSDILQCEIILQENAQSTALGVAFLAGLGSGLYRDLKEIKQLKSIKKMYQPQMSAKEVRQRYAKWKVAISAVTRFV